MKIRIYYIDWRRQRGQPCSILVDHDSMRGEHVGTTSRVIFTSGKAVNWPLAAPENQGFRKLQKFPKEGRDLGKWINKHM